MLNWANLLARSRVTYTTSIVSLFLYRQLQNQYFTVVWFNSLEPPVINESPEDVVMRHQIGANVTFSCTAKGFPRPVITWTHNSEPATVSRYTQTDINLSDNIIESVLTVMDMTAQDSGQVRCIATVTPGGEVSPLETTAEADLSVLSKIVYTFSVLPFNFFF